MTYTIRMTLLSDAIFGSGYSIPGAEDIAVVKDDRGYPYLPGTVLKGLLRESLGNWLAWTDGESSLLSVLMGEEGWEGTADDRRVQVTSLTLRGTDRPAEAAQCYEYRTFTAIENGIAKDGSLRTAACIRSGLVFTGQLICAKEDAALVKDALCAVKWAGGHCSRGFGRVKFELLEECPSVVGRSVVASRFLRFRLFSEAPILITNLNRSYGNSYQTRNYIPGSTIRGMVINALAKQDPNWFEANKEVLLSDQVRFLNAVPVPENLDLPALPAIKGFYEDKAETVFETVVKDGDFTAGLKRAGLGTYCVIEDEKIRYWSVDTGSVTRIQRNIGDEKNTEPFRTNYIKEGQFFEGYIQLDRPEFAPKIASAFMERESVWLGADRFEGFGRCRVEQMESYPEVRKNLWEEYGFSETHAPEKTVYLLALSPIAMLDEQGNPCGLNREALADLLDVSEVTLQHCSTSVSEYGGYNRTWQCYAPAVRMYDAGSIFKLSLSQAPALRNVLSLQQSGLGLRREEGFGQVLLLRPEVFERITGKEKWKSTKETMDSQIAEIRRAKYRWIMAQAPQVYKGGISRSQISDIQSLCEAVKQDAEAGIAVVKAHLEKNLKERGAAHGKRFESINKLINSVLDVPLSETLGIDCPDSAADRLELLCMLFGFSRKGAQ